MFGGQSYKNFHKYCDSLKQIKPKKIETITPENFVTKWKNGENMSKYANKVSWKKISMLQNLPNDFLREFINKIDWLYAYKYQQLPDDLLESTGYELTKWNIIVKFQKLSEEFIEKHAKKLNWNLVWRYQKYSEKFILKHFANANWDIISYTIKIHSPLLKQYVKTSNNWLYLSEELRLKLISKNYKVVTIESKKFVECFKAVRNDDTSIYAPHLKFDKRDYTYETTCDYNYNNSNSFGFGCWTYEEAKSFALNKKIHNYKILKILVPFESCCWTGNFKSNCNFPQFDITLPQYGYVGKLRSSEFQIINFDVPNNL